MGREAVSSPINFPTLSAPQVVQRKHSELDGFAEFLNTLSEQRNARAVQREQLDNARRNLDSNLETDKLSRKKTEREMEIQELRLNAEDIADRYAREATTTPGLDENGVSEIMGRMLSTEDRKLAPYLGAAFARQVGEHQQMLASVAERKRTQIGAEVAGKTKDATVSKALTDAERATTDLKRAGVELETARIQKAIADVERVYGPARAGLAQAALLNGAPLGQAYRISGVPVPPGVDPNWTIPGKDGGAKTEQQRKLEGTAGLATLGNSLIEAAGDPEISRFGAIMRRGGPIGKWTQDLGVHKLSDAERNALTGYRMLGEAFALYVTGQQASGEQINRLVDVVSKQPKERGKVAEDRAFVRQAVVNLIQNAAAGGSAGAGMAEIAKSAKARGLDDRTIKVLEVFAKQAQAHDVLKQVTATQAPGDATVRGRFSAPPAR